jgi:hypothetical protein
MKTGHVIPYSGQNYSGATSCNLLWHCDNIFIMDNHRLALWCWLSFLKNQKQAQSVNLLHLDAHYDCGPIVSTLNRDQLESLSISDYMSLEDHQGEKLIKWDNYLSLFFKIYQENIAHSVAFTHRIGISYPFLHEFEIWDLLKKTPDFFDHPSPWIINLDFDYFYGRQHKNSMMLNPDYISEYFAILKQAYDEGKVAVLTVALSPECCGSWENAKKILSLFNYVFKLELAL